MTSVGRLLIDPHDARIRIRQLIVAGQEILGLDPAKDESGAYRELVEMRDCSRKIRQRTDEWTKLSIEFLTTCFENLRLSESDLLASVSGIYPRLEVLRTLDEQLPIPDLPALVGEITLQDDDDDLLDLHPTIIRHSGTLYTSRHYDEAIFNAFKALETEIRSKSGMALQDLGTGLISKVMNPNSPVIKFSDVPAEQEAFHSLYRGAIGAFKNPHSHRFVKVNNHRDTLDLLRFASLLMRLLEGL